MTTAEKIAVMQAYEDGKTICFRGSEMVKGDGFEPSWNWFNGDYFIKPEPKYGPLSLETFPKVAVWITCDSWGNGTSELIVVKDNYGIRSEAGNLDWDDLMDYKNAETGEYFRVEV